MEYRDTPRRFGCAVRANNHSRTSAKMVTSRLFSVYQQRTYANQPLWCMVYGVNKEAVSCCCRWTVSYRKMGQRSNDRFFLVVTTAAILAALGYIGPHKRDNQLILYWLRQECLNCTDRSWFGLEADRSVFTGNMMEHKKASSHWLIVVIQKIEGHRNKIY